MIPQIENSISNEVIELVNYPSKTYKISETQTAGKVDGLAAIEQAVYHILSVERYAYLIYDDNYGVELEKYIGQDFSYLEATIENALKEALTQDDRILDVQVTDISTSIEEQQAPDLSRLYKRLNTENLKDIVKEQTGYIVTDKVKIPSDLVTSEVSVVNVKFDVYCKEGIIHTEVDVNV